MQATAEVVIVGGGVIGTSCAFHLTQKGMTDVLLVDRGAIGSGQTYKSGGFVQTHWPDAEEVRLIARAREMFQSWGDVVGGDCGWNEVGYLHVTGEKRAEEVRRVHQMLLDEGLESEWIERDDLPKLHPLINTDGLVGGAYERRSGWADSLAATQSLAEAAQHRGAVIREGVTVLQISHRGGKVTGVETTEGFVSAPRVVLAVGPWTSLLHPDPRIHLPIAVKRGQLCYMSRPEDLPEITFYDEVTGVYTHRAGDENLVGIDWPFEMVWGPDQYRREIDDNYAGTARAGLGHRFPALAESRITRGVVGLYDFTPDGQPIIDAVGIDGYYVAAGFCGSGFKSAPVTGDALATLVLAGTHAGIEHLRWDRFTR